MRILIVSADFFKAEGVIAKGIVDALPDCEVFFFSIHEFKYRMDAFLNLMNNVDIVHWLFNVAHLDQKYQHLYTIPSVPQIATVHHVCPDEINKITTASKTDLIHVISNEWKNYINLQGISRVHLAPLGFTREEDGQISAKSKEGKFTIGMSGFYPGKNNRKRADIAIKALKELVGKIDFELIVQGKGWVNYYDEFNKNKIPFKHNKFSRRQRALQFYHKIDLYLCTSDFEGGPLPVLEAMAFGVPVVSTKVGMAMDLLNQGGGLLCDKEKTSCITAHILKLAQDKLYCDKMSIQAGEVAQKYAWKELKKDYLDLYNLGTKNWEDKHNMVWKNDIQISLNPKKQRNIEIGHDNLNQTVSLFKQGRYLDVLIMLFSILKNRSISVDRKLRLLKNLSLNFIFRKRKIRHE